MGVYDRLARQYPHQPVPFREPDPDPIPYKKPSQETMKMMQQELGQIKANPGDYLHAKGYEIPEGMTDAKQITQHLLRTGQIGNQRLQQVMRMLGR